MESCRMKHGSETNHEYRPPKVVVYPTQRSMSVVKSNCLGYVPHEPVKGAASPMIQMSPPVLNHEQIREELTTPSACNKYGRVRSVNRREANQTGQQARILPENTESTRHSQFRNILPTERGSHPSKALQNQVLPFQYAHVTADVDVPVSSSESSTVAPNLPCPLPCDSDLLGASLNSIGALSEANAARNLLEDDGERLKKEDQVQRSHEAVRLKEELEVLTKVNFDLKKLLVASIGDDLHYKVDALVRTKVQLSNEIGDYTRKLVEDYEDLDKLTIQADLWHSKYQASRVLVEQLTSERERLNGLLAQSEAALQYTIQERQEIQQLLLLARKNLCSLVTAHGASGAKNFSTSCPHTLDLAVDIKRMTETVCRSLVGSTLQHGFDVNSGQSFTPAELLTHQVLSSIMSGQTSPGPGQHQTPKPVPRRHLPLLFPRFHPETRYEGFTFACCSRCRGEVIVL